MGSEVLARIVLHPKEGYHVNTDGFPYSLKVTPPAGVEVAKAEQGLEDAAKIEAAEAVFEVKFTARDAGDKRFGAKFKFAVCTANTCVPESANLAWNVNVE